MARFLLIFSIFVGLSLADSVIRQTFHLQSGVRLKDHLYRSRKTPLITLCQQECTNNYKNCDSINYNSMTNVCEMNNARIGDVHENFTASDQHVTYAEIKVTEGPCSVCDTQGTIKCIPGVYNGARFIKQTCLCHTWAYGEFCQHLYGLAPQCSADNQCFQMMTNMDTEEDAATACSALKGFLATADSNGEQETLKQMMIKYNVSAIWLGIKYYPNTETYALSNNYEPVTGYTNWDWSVDLNPSDDNNYCVIIDGYNDYKWANAECDGTINYICQIPSCPEGFEAHNGSCYYWDETARYWARQIDHCIQRDAVTTIPSSLEEDSYLKDIMTNVYGTSHPFALGIHDWDQVYRFKSIYNDWILLDWVNRKEHLGCYQDGNPRAMEVIEGSHSLITDSYQQRTDPILKCYYVAKMRHFKVFSVQNSGHCNSDATAHLTYDRYGTSSGCSGGEGGGMLNDVYKLTDANWYMNFDWEAGGWNQGQRCFWWWHGNSFRAHDAGNTANGRSVCKKEGCPSGFFSYSNKCFKMMGKNMTWEYARDECQSYTNADLFNPEYPDELIILQQELSDQGFSQPVWTGVVDISGEPKYKNMQTKIDDMYNTFRLGAEPIHREVVDGATPGTHVEMRWSFPMDARIIGWEYYAHAANRPLKFHIMRKVRAEEGDCDFYTVGENTLSSASNYQKVMIPEGDQLIAYKGDNIGFSWTTSGSVLRFHSEAGDANFCGSHADVPVPGTIHHFNIVWNRVYSYRAIWRPLNDARQLFDSLTPSLANTQTGGCYAAASSNGELKLRHADCDKELPAICEIKRNRRLSPDPRLDLSIQFRSN